MGWDATNILPASVREAEVARFLKLLGYVSVGRSRATRGAMVLYYHNDLDYQSFQAIRATVERCADGVHVHTRTPTYRSAFDCRYHNHTVRQLRGRFGGTFTTDGGKSRFFPIDGENREKADAGCLLAYWHFGSNLFRASAYLSHRRPVSWPRGVHDEYSPEIVSNHLILPFAVGALQEYLRATYAALLRYSPRKREAMAGVRVSADELLDEAGRRRGLEETVARILIPFDMERATKSFKALDPQLDLWAALIRPTRERRTSLGPALRELIARRHRLVHDAAIDTDYTTARLRRDLNTVALAGFRLYDTILRRYGWDRDHGFGRHSFSERKPGKDANRPPSG